MIPIEELKQAQKASGASNVPALLMIPIEELKLVLLRAMKNFVKLLMIPIEELKPFYIRTLPRRNYNF